METATVNIWTMIASGGDRQEPDMAEVERGLRLLFDPSDEHMIQTLPSAVWAYGGVARLGDALEYVKNWGIDGVGLYWSLNPVGPGHEQRPILNGMVARRRWFLVDLDTVRADRDSSATDGEKEQAARVAAALDEYLCTEGWPAPVLIDSGNGFHLLYRVDLPNDKLAQQILKKCLAALAKRFDTPTVKVDRLTHDARRISKMPGTWARKGMDTAERPHRMCRILSIPSALRTVPGELLSSLAGMSDEPKATAAERGDTIAWQMRATDGPDRLRAYVMSAVDREIARVVLAPEGERNHTLNRAAFAIGTLGHARVFVAGEVCAQLLHAAKRCGLEEAEAQKTIKSGYQAGQKEPRKLPDFHEPTKGHAKPETGDLERLTVRASTIQPKAVHWLWPDRVPVGFITVFAGRTGLGKSFVTCDLAARVTTGRDMPDGTPNAEVGSVLIISEDPYEYVLAPRLIELGADMDRVHFLTWEAMAQYSLENIEMLERAYEEAGKPILIAIDPPTNFLGGADEHKNAEVRRVLMGLVAWLQDKTSACVLITHCNKQAGKGVEALNRVIGSVAWTTTARIAHTFAPDPDDRDRCVFVPMKSNLGMLAKGLGYRIVSTDSLATIEWLGQVDVNADDALNREKKKATREVKAAEWLVERFREKREWFSDDLFAAAKAEGISRDAIFEAKGTLDLPRARKGEMPGGKSAWIWWVPPDWSAFGDFAPVAPVAPF